MYEVFYSFKAEPFRLSPDHKFCYEHKSYAKARAYMAYAFKRAEGFVMITGRPGTGKTTLIGELVESLSRDRVCTANLVCTQLQADDLLKTVAFSFGIGSTGVDKAEMLQRLTVLLHRWHREGRRALLIVDEAQDLSPSAMEELRLLTNIQIGGQPLLQIFLLGQPELRDLILSPEMEQVHQRIVAASHIEGLGVEETEAYVLHRLTVVGWRGDPAIDRAIFPLIHKYSEGVPRRINLICSRLFLLGSVEQRHDIRVEDVRVVITELQAENLAAGTGISQQDFDQVNEPEWVSLPHAEPQVQAPHRLHAVENGPNVSVDHTSTESHIGAKKKDTPDLNLHPDPFTEVHSSGPEEPSVYFQDEPQYDQDMAPPPFGDLINLVPGDAGSEGTESEPLVRSAKSTNVVPDSSRAIGPPSSRRRVIAVGCALVAVLSIIFLTLYLSDHGVGDLTERESVPDAGGHRNSNAPVERLVSQAQLPGALSERQKIVELEPGINDTESLTKPSVSNKSADAAHIELEGPAQYDAVDSTSEADQADQAEPAFANTPPPALSEVPDTGTQVSELMSDATISVSFSFDSDDLIPDSHLALDQAVVLLNENPERIAAITGFTDKQGDEDYNLMLSRRRAEAVKQYLVSAGIAQDRLVVEGRGALIEIAGERSSDAKDPMEPSRVVKIKLSSDRSEAIGRN